jgi:hypothetical protein
MTTDEQDLKYMQFKRKRDAARIDQHDAQRRATEMAEKLVALAKEMGERVKRANDAGPVGTGGFVNADSGIEDLEVYADVANVEQFKKIDEEISKAVADVQRFADEMRHYSS